MAEEKQEPIPFRDFPAELKRYYAKNAAFMLLCVVAMALLFVFFPLYWKSILVFLLVPLLLHAGILLDGLVKIRKRKVLLFTGILERKETSFFGMNPSLKNKKTKTKGATSLLVLLDDNETKVSVPVNSLFSAEQGNEIHIYADPNVIVEANDNTFRIDSPVFVCVSKL